MAITKIEIVSVQALELPTGQAHFYLLAYLDNGSYEILEQHAQDGLLTTDRTSSTSPNPLEREIFGISTLFSGGDVSAQWAQINALADEISGQWEFSLLGPNSTSFIASVLSMMGINLKDVEPPDDLGDLGVDELVGGEHSNHLRGFDGNDIIRGGGGGDILDGGDGESNDSGNDTLWGDEGEEVASAPGNDVLYGRDGNDELYGGFGDDVLYGGSDNDALVGDNYLGTLSIGGADLLYGEGGDDLLYGGAGGDVLHGGADHDILFGDLDGSSEAIGNDTIDGGAGDDRIDGGFGRDELWGGSGDDVFVLASGGYDDSIDWESVGWADTIKDAEAGDTAVFGNITLTGGTLDGYYLYIDEFENGQWLPIESDEGYAYYNEEENIYYSKQDGDLVIALFNEDNQFVEAALVEDWSDGELGIHLTLVDNRPGGGGNAPLLFEGGGDSAIADSSSGITLGAADIFDGRDSFGGATADAPTHGSPVVAALISAAENSASVSADQVALLAA